ncbi:sigma-70 family RNA polymerase sigma factor [Mesobacillus foraminis]|uniref:sigma-70 family RNA polymerase sigma factor n=1 Tax=Mesobacillus foraminis TaxID=279826 RepID=UPI001BE4F5BA|nr:sigma-70 family RNA polymerase sigma factor [Mesobacillus foraminis]MBT2758200.1 sigma-70 family RNA polymerase sigma factor [Mesobacillus foraminis]
MEEFFTEVIETDDKDLLIDEIMHRHGQEILQLVYSYVKNRSIAEDLTQDIFVKCYKSLHTYSGKARIRTWLWRIAINHCKDYLKSWYARNVILTEKEAEPAYHQDKTVEQKVIQKSEDQELAEAVMELPIKYREVIYLFYFEELSIKEISEVTDIKENTVKTRLRRAKDLLKERLEG